MYLNLQRAAQSELRWASPRAQAPSRRFCTALGSLSLEKAPKKLLQNELAACTTPLASGRGKLCRHDPQA